MSSLKDKKVNIKELIKTEYAKCAMDATYFIRTYCFIQHPIRGKILFNLYPYQEEILKKMLGHDKNIVLKARQLGLSTAVSCYALWLAIFHKDKNILAIATKQETAKNIITKAKYAYDNLPVWLRTAFIEKNKLNLRFKNGSQIKAVSSTSEAGRSEAVSLLIIDEAAFIEKADEIWTASQATLATGGSTIIISTPNGVGNFFHKMYSAADAGENGFLPTKLTWRDHPERSNDWYKSQRESYTEREFEQEYEAKFLGSGNTVISVDAIEFYITQQIDPIEKTGVDRNLWIWKYPDRTKQYVLVADVARGDGGDFSAAHVLEVESMEQVAEYKGRMDTGTFGDLLVALATQYNDALLVVENSNIGWDVVQKILYRGYKNLYYMEEDIKVLDESKPQNNYLYRAERKRVPGFTTSVRTRPLIISKLEEYTRNFHVKIHSKRTVDEWLTFIWDKGKAQAQDGYNDDLTMALSIGLWVRDTSLKLLQMNAERTRGAITGIQRNVGEGDAFYQYTGSLQTDPYLFNIGTPRQTLYDSENSFEDLRWLLR